MAAVKTTDVPTNGDEVIMIELDLLIWGVRMRISRLGLVEGHEAGVLVDSSELESVSWMGPGLGKCAGLQGQSGDAQVAAIEVCARVCEDLLELDGQERCRIRSLMARGVGVMSGRRRPEEVVLEAVVVPNQALLFALEILGYAHLPDTGFEQAGQRGRQLIVHWDKRPGGRGKVKDAPGLREPLELAVVRRHHHVWDKRGGDKRGA